MDYSFRSLFLHYKYVGYSPTWVSYLLDFAICAIKKAALQASLIQTMSSSRSHRTARVSVHRKKHMLVCLCMNESYKRDIESTANFKLKTIFSLPKKVALTYLLTE